MPLLALNLVYNKSTGEREKVELNGSIPKQPLRLVHYNIAFTNDDGSAGSTEASIDYLLIKLPFLNSYDINSNFAIEDAIPLFVDRSAYGAQSQYDLEFNPAKNVDEVIDWNIYKPDGTPYTDKRVNVTLLFVYRRSELI